ncbi:MAG: hypothetical protein OEZ58_07830 [Gammaproteobacteria bacterium]|nr:hypothetical protein [Gammaproteobacteria bacterium]MDH5728885.1 hypothetical protein [Gammaproteobacteria bacterium]
MNVSDNTKAYLFLAAFFLGLPMIYLAPTILNALTDIGIKMFGG